MPLLCHRVPHSDFRESNRRHQPTPVVLCRMLSYSDLAPEAPLMIDGQAAGRGGDAASGSGRWITAGKVVFEAVELRYRPGLPLALAGLSFAIEGGQRCAVVGRTGAGKSSIAVALFRLVEPCGGRILIDGVDCMSLGLHQLRRLGGLAVIPQDPVVFSGSLARNLVRRVCFLPHYWCSTPGRCQWILAMDPPKSIEPDSSALVGRSGPGRRVCRRQSRAAAGRAGAVLPLAGGGRCGRDRCSACRRWAGAVHGAASVALHGQGAAAR